MPLTKSLLSAAYQSVFFSGHSVMVNLQLSLPQPVTFRGKHRALSARGSSNGQNQKHPSKLPSSSSTPPCVGAGLLTAKSVQYQHPVNKVCVKSVAAIIFGDGSETRLYPLTKRRSEGAIPVAANYRLVDCVVSNCINSNINKIYALTQFNSTSLNSHLSRAYSGVGLGKEGFVEVIAAYQSPEDQDWFQGTADAVRKCLWVLDEYPMTEFLVLPGHHLYKLDYQRLVEAHRNANADITIVGLRDTRIHDPGFGFFKVNSENQVLGFRQKLEPEESGRTSDDDEYSSTGIYLINRDKMVELLREYLPKANDFKREVIPGALSVGMKVHAFLFDEYWEDMRSIQAFYQANMESTKRTNMAFNFYDRDSPIYTMPRHLPPTLVSEAVIKDSVIGDGCILNGCNIKGSVVGMRTKVGERAMIEDSVIMGADTYQTDDIRRINGMGAKGTVIPIGIGQNAQIRRAIIDKNARIGKNVMIINKDNVQEANREGNGYIISSGIVVVLKNATIHDGRIV